MFFKPYCPKCGELLLVLDLPLDSSTFDVSLVKDVCCLKCKWRGSGRQWTMREVPDPNALSKPFKGRPV
jgi:hypothetical protein